MPAGLVRAQNKNSADHLIHTVSDMTIRPLITAPLPWLTMLAGRLWGAREPHSSAAKPSRWPRSLSVTREGRWYIGILLFIGVAAINTGNNLLYLVVATLLSIIVISGILSESTLRAVKVRLEVSGRVFKGQPATIYFKIRNSKRLIPSFSFIIRELTGAAMAQDVYVLKLDPGTEITRAASATFDRRGRLKISGVKVSTRFPFGIFKKGKTELIAAEVLVYPDIFSGSSASDAHRRRANGDVYGGRKGQGTQIHSLREYTLSDDSRFIHWMSAGRATRLLMKEFEVETEKKVMIEFENYASQTPEIFESMVDAAATVAADHLGCGYSVGLKTLSFETAPRPGQAQLDSLLTRLALIEPVHGTKEPSISVIE